MAFFCNFIDVLSLVAYFALVFVTAAGVDYNS